MASNGAKGNGSPHEVVPQKSATDGTTVLSWSSFPPESCTISASGPQFLGRTSAANWSGDSFICDCNSMRVLIPSTHKFCKENCSPRRGMPWWGTENFDNVY